MKIAAIILLAFFSEFQFIEAESAVAFSVGWPECNLNVVSWHSHPASCSKYAICFYANIKIYPCAPGFHFSPTQKQCMEPAKAKCDVNYACPEKDDELNPIFFPNTADCSSYFVCHKGRPIIKACASGLFWDQENNWCTYPENVTCSSSDSSDPSDVGSSREFSTFRKGKKNDFNLHFSPSNSTTTNNLCILSYNLKLDFLFKVFLILELPTEQWNLFPLAPVFL